MCIYIYIFFTKGYSNLLYFPWPEKRVAIAFSKTFKDFQIQSFTVASDFISHTSALLHICCTFALFKQDPGCIARPQTTGTENFA